VNNLITINDKSFKQYISRQEISEAVKKVSQQIDTDLKDDFPVFLVVLNGAFVFAADLLREISIPCDISFIKLASYQGLVSSGEVNELIGLSEDVTGRTVVIVEDIVDTGETIDKIIKELAKRKVEKIKIATALFKPKAYTKGYKVDYSALQIENDFVVGYGMDYNGKGRNLKDLFVLA
jgi:hypoxanthine phosphoribosyltransferase